MVLHPSQTDFATRKSTLRELEAKWDDAKEKMRVVLASLWREANEKAPINCLPTEVLVMIFKHALEFPSAPSTISHTCVHWRTVMLGDPTMWTHIDLCCSRPALWQEWFRRSKDSLLSLSFTPSGYMHEPVKPGYHRHSRYARVPMLYAGTQASKVNDVLGRIAAEMHRVRDIEFVVPLTGREAYVPGWLRTCHAPALEKLSLMSREYEIPYLNRYHSDAPLTTLILPEILPGHMPHLRSLTLTGTRPLWNSPLFSGLTSLDITMERRGPPVGFMNEPFAEGNILTALERMPNLQTLHIVIPYTVGGWNSEIDQTVSLLRLSSLHLDVPDTDLTYLLSHIRVPAALEAIHLEAHGGDGVLAGCLPRNAANLASFDGIQSMHVDFTGRISFSHHPSAVPSGANATHANKLWASAVLVLIPHPAGRAVAKSQVPFCCSGPAIITRRHDMGATANPARIIFGRRMV